MREPGIVLPPIQRPEQPRVRWGRVPGGDPSKVGEGAGERTSAGAVRPSATGGGFHAHPVVWTIPDLCGARRVGVANPGRPTTPSFEPGFALLFNGEGSDRLERERRAARPSTAKDRGPTRADLRSRKGSSSSIPRSRGRTSGSRRKKKVCRRRPTSSSTTSPGKGPATMIFFPARCQVRHQDAPTSRISSRTSGTSSRSSSKGDKIEFKSNGEVQRTGKTKSKKFGLRDACWSSGPIEYRPHGASWTGDEVTSGLPLEGFCFAWRETSGRPVTVFRALPRVLASPAALPFSPLRRGAEQRFFGGKNASSAPPPCAPPEQPQLHQPRGGTAGVWAGWLHLPAGQPPCRFLMFHGAEGMGKVVAAG